MKKKQPKKKYPKLSNPYYSMAVATGDYSLLVLPSGQGIEEIALALAKECECKVYIRHYSGVKTSLEYSPKEWTLWERIKFVFTNEK